MKDYTLRIETIKTEQNSHLDVDFVDITIDDNLVNDIVKAAQKVEQGEFISIDMNFKWLYKGKETQERLQYEELHVYGDGDIIARCLAKYCLSDIETHFFRIKEVDELLSAKKKAKVTQIDVCTNSLESFTEDGKCLLISYADLISRSGLKPQIVLYVNSLKTLLDSIENESKYTDEKFNEFKTRIQDLIKANADQYIFNWELTADALKEFAGKEKLNYDPTKTIGG